MRLTDKGRATVNVATHLLTIAIGFGALYGAFAIAFLLSR